MSKRTASIAAANVATATNTAPENTMNTSTAATDNAAPVAVIVANPAHLAAYDAGNGAAMALFGENLKCFVIASKWQEFFGTAFPLDIFAVATACAQGKPAMPADLIESFMVETARRDGMREFFAALCEGVTITGECYGRTVLGEVTKIDRGQGRHGTTTVTIVGLDGGEERLDWKSRGITGLRVARLGEIKALILRVERESAAAAAGAKVEQVSTQTDASAETAAPKGNAKKSRKGASADAPGLALG